MGNFFDALIDPGKEFFGLDIEKDMAAFSGEAGAKAALDAAQLQYKSSERGIDYQEETRDQLLALMKPYVDAGMISMPQLQNMLNQPQDTTALDAATQLAGYTRPTYETRAVEPAQQLSGSNLSPEGASIIGRSTYTPNQKRTVNAVTPNSAGRDQFGNMALTTLPSNNASSGYTVDRMGRLQDPDGNYEDDANFMDMPAGATITPSSNYASLGQSNLQQTPVQQQAAAPEEVAAPTTVPVTYETIQTSPGSYEPIDRPMLTAFNDKINAGRDTSSLDRMTSLATDPTAQAGFISDNPFYGAMADNAQNRIFSNQAARGKVGSGGTAKGLQDSLVQMGSDLLSREIGNLSTADTAGRTSYQNELGNLGTGLSVNEGIRDSDINQLLNFQGIDTQMRNQDLNNLFQMVGMGQNAAAGQGTSMQGNTNNIVDLLTGGASALGAGGVGAANNYGQGAENKAAVAAGVAKLFLSDKRSKENIEPDGVIETDDFTYPAYTYNYIGDDEKHRNVIAQDVEVINPIAVANINGIKFVRAEAL